MRREYQKTLDVDIDYITIGSLRKDDVGDTVTIHSDDISRWGYVSLKEDLFKNFMSCEIMIVDQDGFFLNRFRTEEVIVIKFKTPPLKGSPDFDTRLHYFYLYKIDPVTIMDKPYGAVYVVHGISFEYFYNSLRTFSKALKGKTEKIASDIYYEFLEAKSQRTIKKTLKVGRPTKHEMKFTFPYVNPVDAINHLASVSIDSKNPDICNYVFFENKDGFNFISITELIETPRKTHNYITNKIMEDPYYEFDKYFYNTMNILPTNTGDKIIDTLDGIHGEYFAEFDLLYKSYKPYTTRVDGKTTYGKRYLDYFPKTKHLNPKPLLSKENELFKHPLGRNRVCFTNASLYSEERNLGGDRKEWRLFDTHEGEYSFQRRSMMQQINGFNIEVTVPGNSSITVGDIFVLDTIIYRTEDKEKYLSGKYLITAVNHHIALGTGYKCVLTLSRDSILSDDFDDNTKAETGD